MAPKKATVKSRNPELIRGIRKYSRLKMYHKRGIWAIKFKHGGVLPRHEPKAAPPKPAEKPPKFYPADDVKTPIPNRRKHRPTKLRPSITSGTVLILLAGRFMGKRVVFLKQLPSGLLLVSGECLQLGVTWVYLYCIVKVAETSGPEGEIVGLVRGCIKTVACGKKPQRAGAPTRHHTPSPIYTKVAYLLGLRVSPSHR